MSTVSTPLVHRTQILYMYPASILVAVYIVRGFVVENHITLGSGNGVEQSDLRTSQDSMARAQKFGLFGVIRSSKKSSYP